MKCKINTILSLHLYTTFICFSFCNKESKILWKHINWSYPGKRRNNLYTTSNSSCCIQPRWHCCCYCQTILWHGDWWVSIRTVRQKTKLVCKGQWVAYFRIWWSVIGILLDILIWACNSLFIYGLLDSYSIFDFQNSSATMKRRGFMRPWRNWDLWQNTLRLLKIVYIEKICYLSYKEHILECHDIIPFINFAKG